MPDTTVDHHPFGRHDEAPVRILVGGFVPTDGGSPPPTARAPVAPMREDRPMVLRIAGLPVWVGPTDMIAGARAVMGWTDEAAALVAGLPGRVSGLLDDVEGLVGRITRIADEVDEIVGSVEGVLGSVHASIARVDGVVDRAEATVRHVEPLLAEVHTVSGGAAALVGRAGEVAEGAAVLVTRADTVAEGAADLVARAGGVADRAAAVVGQATEAADGASTLLALYRPIVERAEPLARRFVEEFSEEELRAAIRLVDQLPQLTEHMENDIMPILATLDRVGPDVHELLNQLNEVRQAIQGIPGFRMFRRRGEREEAEEGRRDG
jgi:hypothetical protein